MSFLSEEEVGYLVAAAPGTLHPLPITVSRDGVWAGPGSPWSPRRSYTRHPVSALSTRSISVFRSRLMCDRPHFFSEATLLTRLKSATKPACFWLKKRRR